MLEGYIMNEEICGELKYKWTRDTVMCYRRKGICKGCILKEILTSIDCNLKAVVIRLVREKGLFNEEDFD